MKQNNLKKVKNLPENTNDKIRELEQSNSEIKTNIQEIKTNITNIQNELTEQKQRAIVVVNKLLEI